MEKIRFTGRDKKDFFPVLRKRVDAYFRENGITRHANGMMIFKIVFFLCSLAGIWALLVFGGFGTLANMGLWIALGAFTAFVGVNISHDAIHGAISGKAWVNKFLGYTLNLAGANAYLWSIMHNKVHHPYTNIRDFDEDIEATSLLRLHPHAKRRGIHRFQHLYALFVYGLTSLSWVFIKDYRKISQEKIGSYKTPSHPAIEYVILFISKAVYYTLFLVLPLVMLEQSWWLILIGFFLMHFVEGILLAVIITLSHVVEGVEFPVPDNKGEIENSWAVHQMHTTADYARKSAMVGFFTGGLNFHIEHHLFPSICHIHHAHISRIVKQTAEEFGIPYMEFKTVFGALGSHLRFLERLGNSDQPLAA